MVDLYSESDLKSVEKQKKAVLTVYYSVLLFYLAVSIVILIIYAVQDYETPLRTPLLVAECFLTAIFIVFSYIFVEIKIKRVKAYKNFLTSVLEIQPVEGFHVFVQKENSITVKDKVEFIPLVFLEWSEKQHEFYNTTIYFDKEKPIPEFKKGDKVYHKTYANVLVAYEVRNDIFS